jgi:hypothetical protein
MNPTKRGKPEGNTKINVAFPNVFVLFGVSCWNRGWGELNLRYISVKLNVALLLATECHIYCGLFIAQGV